MPRLHGRRGELEQLEAWLGRAAAGALQVVIVEGEAGIGKSTLLEAALARASERGFRVLAGYSDELERARPFGPMLEALGRLAGPELAALLAEEERGQVEPAGDPGLQFRIVDALVGAVEKAALARPLVLAIEDIQWADASTLLTLRSLSRRTVYLPVALLATVRPLPLPHRLERLLDALSRDGAHQLLLEALDEQAVEAVVADLTGVAPSPTLLEKARGAAGNPLFVRELVKALEGGAADFADTSLPRSLRLTILRRLSFLGDEARDVLRPASLFGSTFSLRDVATVLGRSPPELLRPVREAVQAGVLAEHRSRLRFRHDLIREAIYEDLPRDVRAALHLEAGRRLAEAGAPPLQVAEQFARGARPGDEDAVSWLHAAGREAARRDPVTGTELLEKALELSHERAPILADIIPPLLWSGRPQAAEARAREALAADAPGALEGPLRLGLVQALAVQGRYGAVIDEAASALSLQLGADVRSQLQAQAANAHVLLGDLEACEAVARDAVATGTQARSEGAEMGLLVLSDAARDRGRLDESLAHAEEALRRAEARGGARLHWRPGIFLAMALRGLDRLDDAQEAIRRARDADERAGYAPYLPVYHYESASELFLAGRWDEAAAEAEAGLALADEVGLEMLLHWPHGLLARLAIHRGELEAADASLGAAPPAGPDAAVARSLLAEARGDVTTALATLQDAWESDVQRGVLSSRRILGPDLVRLARATGDLPLAATVAAGVAEAAVLASVPSLEGAALRCRGLAAADAQLLLRSVDAYRRGPRAFERARACEDAATALGRSRRPAEAKPLFDEALDLYEDIGAHRDAARALAVMREIGVGRKRRGARKRPERGWEALTPSELEVVKLAAAGLTNPEIGRRLFVSPRTVQTHLKHAFQKLELGSRVHLAAEVAKRSGL
jgi:DNA-binding CsgD family transcriptional regulator